MTTTSTTPSVDPAPAGRTPNGLSPWQKAVGVLGLVVVLWVGDRLYQVIDSGGRGPGGEHQPGGGPPMGQPTDTGTPTPGGADGRHDPSQFDHGR